MGNSSSKFHDDDRRILATELIEHLVLCLNIATGLLKDSCMIFSKSDSDSKDNQFN